MRSNKMRTIQILEAEHEEILEFVGYVEMECLQILQGKEVQEDFFRKSIVFIREFADNIHHKKEEDILFRYMMDHLGDVATKLIRSGMLVEHQLARYHVMELENNLNTYLETKEDINKLQIIVHAMSYVNLLRSHIDKENNAVYPFGERSLSKEIKEHVEQDMALALKEEQGRLAGKEALLEEFRESFR